MRKLNHHSVECPKVINDRADVEHSHNIEAVDSGRFCDISKSVYKSKANSDEIRNNLKKMNGDKCCYCGQGTGNDIRMDVEHYRPTNEVRYSKKIKFEYGYYWLSAKWNNLLPSCSNCNSEVYKEVYDYNEGQWIEAVLTGKGINFPLYINPRCEPDHRLDCFWEIPLIFNPIYINPKNVFSYEKSYDEEKGFIIFIKPNDGCHSIQRLIADTSISILGLNRAHLCLERARQFRLVESAIEMLRKALETSQVNKKIVSDQITVLLPIINPNFKYASFVGMTWHYFYSDIKFCCELINALEGERLKNNSQEEILRILFKFRTSYSVVQPAKTRIIRVLRA